MKGPEIKQLRTGTGVFEDTRGECDNLLGLDWKTLGSCATFECRLYLGDNLMILKGFRQGSDRIRLP